MTQWLSPLRYPGSKRRLVPYLRKTLSSNDVSCSLYVEPFAGGASTALQLLGEGTARRVGLADRDPLVADFWRCVFNDTDWLIRQIKDVEICLSRWTELKDIARSDGLDRRQRALACLFLNRTSFSGILHDSAGPLGGTEQVSDYKLDCRFPRSTLIDRVKKLGELRERIAFIWQTDWRQTLGMIGYLQKTGRLTDEVVYYCDPPFFKKSPRLYHYSFQDADHRSLQTKLSKLEAPWILSYDSQDRVEALYGDTDLTLSSVEIVYLNDSKERVAAREALITNLPELPQRVELWRKNGRSGVIRRP